MLLGCSLLFGDNMACQECYKQEECEFPLTFGCYYRDYDCEYGCGECLETDECKYESGELGAMIYAFNKLVEDGQTKYNPFVRYDRME